MISKKNFAKTMQILYDYSKLATLLDDNGIDIWSSDSVTNKMYNVMLDHLNDAMELTYIDNIGTLLDYYIYELNWGRDDTLNPNDSLLCGLDFDTLYDILLEEN